MRYAVRLTCCGVGMTMASRLPEFDTWEEADAYRRDWEESGQHDTAIGVDGHERVGFITEVDEVTP